MEQKTIKERVAKAKLTPVENEIRKYILREFARNSKAPDPEKIMKKLKLSSLNTVIKTIEKLEKADILMKDGDEIISAYPFSASETRHKVIFEDGHVVYALCATDALGVHFMLDRNITILSTCPECEKEIKIVLKNGRIKQCEPKEVIEFVGNKEKCGCAIETRCPFINFFCSKEHVKEWREKNMEYQHGEIYSLNEALKHAKSIFEDILK